ncbi:HesA/MoeB/ThiF family protein [Campylobacter portucalensis]|uniref:HesA/MoeB/ThiF family protein n=1 Tax=Campylobacter portucalensis TaxID=2608384 RepID=UPI002DDB9A2D|nr:ThiF family adenylyltransferase [Campylobacter portucalensis]
MVGSGGLGGNLALSLGASEIGEIHIVDFDKVSLHNIHRQVIFTLEDEGKFKVDVFKKVVESRFDGVKVISYLMRFSQFAKSNVTKFDLILDATDNLQTRGEISRFAKSTPWIFAAVEEFHGQVCFIKEANFEPFVKQNLTPGGIAAPIVMFIAAFEANLAIRYLAGLEVVFDMLYYLDMHSEELKVSKFKLPI